jgi:hypothetical protein
LPLVLSTRTASILNSRVYVLLFAIAFLPSSIIPDLRYSGVHSFGGSPRCPTRATV